MNESSLSTEKNWLIRSSTRILGPYTIDEVTALLAGKQISIIDEIRQPNVRWSYIRENRKFLDLVKNLRREEDNAVDNTVTSASTVTSHTSFTKTDAITDDDFTPTPIVSSDSFLRQQSGMKDVTASATKMPAKPAKIPTPKPMRSPQAEVRLSKSVKHFKLAITGMGLIVLAYMGWTSLRKTQQVVSGAEELIPLVSRYKDLGLYEKAIEAYKKIQSSREPNFELQYIVAPLLISEDRQSLLGRRILEKAIVTEGRSRYDLMSAHIGIALTYMQEGELKEAENYLQKAMTFEPNNFEAQVNMAIILIKKGSYVDGARALDGLAKKQADSLILLGLRAIAWIEAAKVNVDTSALQEVMDDIKKRFNGENYMRQELSLLQMKLAQVVGDTTSYNEALRVFLSQQPLQASRFLHALFIDWRMMDWNYIEKYCAEALSGKLNSYQKAARAICLMEVNRDDEASRLLTEAITENPRDPSLLAIEAAYLNKIKRVTEASALLKMPEVASLSIAMQIAGRICMQNNSKECASTHFKNLYQKDKRNIYALHGLAWLAMQDKDRKKAYEFVKAGLQAEPGYLPLVELRDELESQ